MRLLIALIVIIYLVGVGVVLSPTVRSTWNSEPASALADHVVQALPDALTWPVRAVHAFAGAPERCTHHDFAVPEAGR